MPKLEMTAAQSLAEKGPHLVIVSSSASIDFPEINALDLYTKLTTAVLVNNQGELS